MVTWQSEQTPITPDLERALMGLAIGEVSAPLETPLGYVLLQRLATVPRPQQLAGAHILIAYRDAPKPRQGVTRTRDEALRLATELAGQARATPSSFGALARARSDDGTAAAGGELGAWVVGEKMPRAIDDAVRAVEIGAIAGPVETEFGFHVLVRRASPQDRADSYARGPLAEREDAEADAHAHLEAPAPD
jgi:parvulin-like peptidyl-prolyl isomerase